MQGEDYGVACTGRAGAEANVATTNPEAIEQAAEWIARADSLVIAAGAGMGVDSGLPDFRGTEGFWRAYPALAKSGIRFEDIASSVTFRHDPRLAWGFYGHRLNLYRRTVPHEGYDTLRRWAQTKPHGAFVFTSNVDGQFQKAGFAEDRVCEAHGSIHHLQCLEGCCVDIWPADDFEPEVDEDRCRLVSDWPRCPRCGSMARPNVFMFGDYEWLSDRADEQQARLNEWSMPVQRPVVIEIGAGTAIPTVRHFTERFGARFVRINAREPEVRGTLGLGLREGGRQTLRMLAAAIGDLARDFRSTAPSDLA